MVEITQAFTIKGDNIFGKVVIEDTQTVQHRVFFKVVKSDFTLQRLMGFKTSEKGEKQGRPLSSTDIIEQLTIMRNIKYDEYCQPLVEDTLDIDDADTKRKKQKPRDDMPPIADIVAPAHGDIESKQIAVLMSGPNKPLQIELTAENICYLQAVAGAQSSSGEIKRAAPKRPAEEQTSCPPGVTFCHTGNNNNNNVYPENTE